MSTNNGILVSIIAASLFALSSGSAIASNGPACVDAQVIDALDIGYNPDNANGPDAGSSVEVTFRDGQVLAMDNFINLNDDAGREMYDTLLHAMKKPFLVSVWDNRGPKDCTDFDEIKVTVQTDTEE